MGVGWLIFILGSKTLADNLAPSDIACGQFKDSVDLSTIKSYKYGNILCWYNQQHYKWH